MSRERNQEDNERIRDRQLRNILLRPRQDRYPDTVHLTSPRGHAILLRGLASWPDDKTFGILEQKLRERSIEVTRFSYYGAGYSHYTPIDTVKSIDKVSVVLADHVKAIDTGLPIYLLAHSLGGLVLSYWIGRLNDHPDYRETLETVQGKVSGIYFFASPVFLQKNRFSLTNPTNQKPMVMELGDYVRHNKEILRRFSNVHVFYCKRDAIAPKHEASFVANKADLGGEPKTELEIESKPDEAEPCTHESICNQRRVVDAVMSTID